MKRRLLTTCSVVLLAGMVSTHALAQDEAKEAVDASVVAEEIDVPPSEDPNAAGFAEAQAAADKAALKAAKKKAKKKKAAQAEPEEEPARDIPLIEVDNEKMVAPDVNYVTGGVGEDERAAIEAARADYNVHITNASVRGPFVGDVRVVVQRIEADQEKRVVLSVASGPLLYVKLAPGRYVMDARIGQQSHQKSFTVAKKPVRVELRWQASTHQPDAAE